MIYRFTQFRTLLISRKIGITLPMYNTSTEHVMSLNNSEPILICNVCYTMISSFIPPAVASLDTLPCHTNFMLGAVLVAVPVLVVPKLILKRISTNCIELLISSYMNKNYGEAKINLQLGLTILTHSKPNHLC